MIRFLHTADWQIGMKAGHVAPVAEKVRQARLETAKRLMLLAKEYRLDFVVIAGDIFENNLVKNEVAHQIVNILSKCAPIPVYILPGNHDPLTPDSIYNRPVFKDGLPPNVQILRTNDPVIPVPGVALLPAPTKSKKSKSDPTDSFTTLPNDNVIKIGIAHGSLCLEGQYQPDDFPIALNAAERNCLDYLALGHWHSFFHFSERIVYPGTPEPTGFDERDSGTAALVTISGPGQKPQVEKLAVANLRWEVISQEVADNPGEAIRQIQRRVEQFEAPGSTLLRLVLSGRSTSEELGCRLKELEEWLQARLLYAHLDCTSLATQPVGPELRNLARTDAFLQAVLRDLVITGQILGKSLDLPPEEFGEMSSDAGPTEEVISEFLNSGFQPADVEEAIKILAEVAGEVHS